MIASEVPPPGNVDGLGKGGRKGGLAGMIASEVPPPGNVDVHRSRCCVTGGSDMHTPADDTNCSCSVRTCSSARARTETSEVMRRSWRRPGTNDLYGTTQLAWNQSMPKTSSSARQPRDQVSTFIAS